MPKFINLTGQKFGRLEVIKQVGKDKWGKIRWLCRCDCKGKIIVFGYSLKNGHTQSCGCLHNEQFSTRMIIHGHSKRGEKPKGRSLDRKNNNKNYCKSNCRWATPKEQARNTRGNLYITHGRKTQLLVEWSEETGIPYRVLWKRIYVYGWPLEKALITLVRKYKKIGEFKI